VVGDTATVLVQTGPQRVQVVGIARFGAADSPAGSSVVLFTKAAAERLVGQPGKVDGIGVVAAEGVSQQELRDRVARVTPPSVEVVTGKVIEQESRRAVKDIINIANRFLLTFAVIALFVGSFIIYNTFSILVAQRTRDMALLRAVGASRRQVLGSVLLEAVVVGLIAAVLGLVAGIGVVRWESVIIALLGAFLGLAIGLFSGWAMVTAVADEGAMLQLPAGQLAAVALIAALAGMLAAVVPALRASRLNLLAAIATE